MTRKGKEMKVIKTCKGMVASGSLGTRVMVPFAASYGRVRELLVVGPLQKVRKRGKCRARRLSRGGWEGRVPRNERLQKSNGTRIWHLREKRWKARRA